MRKLAVAGIEFCFGFYRRVVSPMVHLWAGPGLGCRFEETCSQYTKRQLLEQGMIKGAWMSMKRILRCQPWWGSALALVVSFGAHAAETKTTLHDGAAWLSTWDLASYKTTVDELLHKLPAVEVGFDNSELLYLKKVQAPWKQEGDRRVWKFEDNNVVLEREATYDEATHTWLFKARGKVKPGAKVQKPKHVFISAEAVFHGQDTDASDRQVVWYANKNVERQAIGSKFDTAATGEGVKWVGFQSRYFAFVLLPASEGAWSGLRQSLVDEGGAGARASLVAPVSGDAFDVAFKVFYGPQDLSLMQKVEPTLDILVDFGWFTLVAYPLLKMMKLFYAFLGNYGWAIILLTLLIKLLTYPLSYKSMASMKEMAKIQPQIQKLKEKYGDNKEAMNREMLTLMRTHGYNPAAGCLPILVQMPVFFALYQVLYKSVELYQAPFGLWIHDLSVKDPYYVTPLLLTGVMFLQQRMTPMTTMDPTQQKIMQFMPLMFGFMMVTLPSGLTIYMLVNTVVSIVQQKLMNKRFESRRA